MKQLVMHAKPNYQSKQEAVALSPDSWQLHWVLFCHS